MVIHYFTVRLEKVQLSRVRTNSSVATSLEDSIPRGMPPSGGVKPSGIRRFFDIVNEMDHVISLSVGEPDFQTPWHVRQAGIASLEAGKTWYTPNRGFKELCLEITKFYKRK